MILDRSTLLVVTCVLTFAVGCQARDTRALATWGLAHLVASAGSGLIALRGVVPDALSIGLANVLILSAYGLLWSGLRLFEGRPALPVAALAGGAAWIVLCLVPSFYASLSARIVVASCLVTLYCALAAREVWRGRDEALVSRYPALALIATCGIVYAVRVPIAILTVPAPGNDLLESPWVVAVCFVSMLFTVGIAFTLITLTKERAEHVQRRAAETDPLTGLLNRRALTERSAAILAHRSRPACLLVFDLDHFKRVNDTYGHEVGDGVLVGFATLARGLLPPEAVLGRLGGEEFACLLPDRSLDEAAAAAGRVRLAMAEIARAQLPGLALGVSVGVAQRPRGRAIGFSALMREADAALYRAKGAGRNRVELARSRPAAAA